MLLPLLGLAAGLLFLASRSSAPAASAPAAAPPGSDGTPGGDGKSGTGTGGTGTGGTGTGGTATPLTTTPMTLTSSALSRLAKKATAVAPPPADAEPPPPPPPPASVYPETITVEPGKMRYCAFEGESTLRLPAGARWRKPAAEVYYTTGEWGTDRTFASLEGTSGSIKLYAMKSYFSVDLFWTDASGKAQETNLQFSGPNTPGDPSDRTLCNLAGCPSCEGLAPGTRVAGASRPRPARG